MHRAGILRYVLDRYELKYAPAVAGELLERFPSGREFWRLARVGALDVVAASPQVTEFGPVEREAISVALEHPDWVLLMDDYRPFRAATALGITAVCSPVLTVALFAENALSAAEALTILARLAAMQTVSPFLLTAALAQLGEQMRSS